MQVFLILNYNTASLCKNLIAQLVVLKQPIVIVDNNSDANDYNMLAQHVKDYSDVTILRLDTNNGFSNGNNVGYRYIVKNFNQVEAIHCLNTDIYLHNPTQLLDIVKNNIKQNYLLAPKVLTNGYLSTPLSVRSLNHIQSQIKQEIDHYQKKIYKHQLAKLLGPYYKKYMKKHQSFVQTHDFDTINHSLQDDEYFVYNGCYLIFTKHYIEKYDYLFDPQTFLYYEEDFLFYRLFTNHESVSYVDAIVVDHLENQASRSNVCGKYKHLLASSRLFLQEVGHD